ncbi:MAG: indolepyruvate ferredoxin oxidoreductase family protein, partial [Fimbriimonadaceae bacterium]|nr:indolepyruvate ferredoxin oxidoreductase family protein [Alphaproteobacteria bacterium]
MDLKPVTLGDKYDLEKDSILISGTQALVRLTLMQKKRDEAAGLNTAGLVSGYRGSPLGGVDQQFTRAGNIIGKYNVTFQPGLNEDLAATALWGSQQAEMRGEGKYDGVFGMWYGKGPGVDRTGDVFRHANAAGSSKYGGVLVLMGDDHTAESSTVAHQSEFALMDAMIPVLNPAGVQEILDYGLLGFELARFSGCWVGLKCLHDNIESTAVVEGSPERIKTVHPKDFDMPEGGLNIRPWDDRHEQERRLHLHKRFAAVSFARANKIDRIVLEGGKRPKIGIVTTGKSYLDTREAMNALGIDEVEAANIGLRLLKIGMVWPLDYEIVKKFADGLDLIIVVEEKRSLLETQIREQLYGAKKAPVIIGKKDEQDKSLFQAHGALDPNQIAVALAERILNRKKNDALQEKLADVVAATRKIRNAPDVAARIPYFCAGCPHNSSTIVPEGGRGYAGIGCHWMAHFVEDRRTEGSTHMGGEGANWIGEAPFSTRKHVFQNLGDGTYNHSGILALRATLAAGVTMTYKILYNDAVAMTGGQPHEGTLTVPMIARQVAAEGVERILVVSDEPDKYPPDANFPPFVTFHHRSELDELQKELMETEGVSVLIYDQTCAAEKRRRRKRGLFPDPAKRVFINDLVCEGCGDCGVKSNCVAVAPLETEFGRKRKIDQSACNKDFSCLNGFCPSFVTVEGGQLRKGKGLEAQSLPAPLFEALPEPVLPELNRPWGMMITGIGGTGVVTVGQILGMAAHLEGKGAGIIDMAGLSQKNGAVVTHMK